MEDKFEITKDTLLSELIEKEEKIEDVLVGFGLSCCSCPMHTFDTIQDAADIHGVDADLLIEKCKEYFEEKDKKSK